jgi:hypothetical protein
MTDVIFSYRCFLWGDFLNIYFLVKCINIQKYLNFIYLYETALKKPLAIALSGVGRGLRGEK